jgi:hypothetical protein
MIWFIWIKIDNNCFFHDQSLLYKIFFFIYLLSLFYIFLKDCLLLIVFDDFIWITIHNNCLFYVIYKCNRTLHGLLVDVTPFFVYSIQHEVHSYLAVTLLHFRIEFLRVNLIEISSRIVSINQDSVIIFNFFCYIYIKKKKYIYIY